jgi:hypothetical protein
MWGLGWIPLLAKLMFLCSLWYWHAPFCCTWCWYQLPFLYCAAPGLFGGCVIAGLFCVACAVTGFDRVVPWVGLLYLLCLLLVCWPQLLAVVPCADFCALSCLGTLVPAGTSEARCYLVLYSLGWFFFCPSCMAEFAILISALWWAAWIECFDCSVLCWFVWSGSCPNTWITPLSCADMVLCYWYCYGLCTALACCLNSSLADPWYIGTTSTSEVRVRVLGCACLCLTVLAWLISILFSCACFWTRCSPGVGTLSSCSSCLGLSQLGLNGFGCDDLNRIDNGLVDLGFEE